MKIIIPRDYNFFDIHDNCLMLPLSSEEGCYGKSEGWPEGTAKGSTQNRLLKFFIKPVLVGFQN